MTHTNWMFGAFHITHRSYFSVLKRFWHWLLVLGLIGIGLDEYTLQFQKLMDQYDSPPIPLVIALLAIGLLWQVAEGALVIILASIGTQDVLASPPTRTSVVKLTRETMKPLTIETLRALGNSLVWCYAFLVPGVIKYLRYTFVPYVVLFEPAYARGEVDALARSNALVRGHTFPIAFFLLVYFVSLMAFSWLTQSFQSSLFENPMGVIFSQIFFQIMNLYFAVFLFASYESLNKIRPHSL